LRSRCWARDATQTRRESKRNQLCLGYQSHESYLSRFQSRVPDLWSASAMKRRSGGYHVEPSLAAPTKFVCYSSGGSALASAGRLCVSLQPVVSAKRQSHCAGIVWPRVQRSGRAPFSQLPCLARRCGEVIPINWANGSGRAVDVRVGSWIFLCKGACALICAPRGELFCTRVPGRRRNALSEASATFARARHRALRAALASTLLNGLRPSSAPPRRQIRAISGEQRHGSDHAG